MCHSVPDSASQLHEVVPRIELSFLILAGEGPVNQSWFALGFQKQVGPSIMHAAPVVLMHDHCEDG